jgi:hypothetical protein
VSPQTPLVGLDLDGALTIVFVVIGLLSTLARALGQQRAQKKAAEQRQAREQGPGGVAGPPSGEAAKRPEAVEQEIAEFLRRAAEGRAGKRGPVQGGAVSVGGAAAGRSLPSRPAQGGPIRPRPAQSGPVASRPSARGPARPRSPQAGSVPPRPSQPRPVSPRKVEGPVAAEIVEPTAGPVGGRVEAAVAKDLGASKLRQRAKQLGQATRRASEETQKRVHEKFDQELARTAGQASAQAVTPPAPVSPDVPGTGAAELAAMFRDVNGVREAILLNEILTRPVDRW